MTLSGAFLPPQLHGLLLILVPREPVPPAQDLPAAFLRADPLAAPKDLFAGNSHQKSEGAAGPCPRAAAAEAGMQELGQPCPSTATKPVLVLRDIREAGRQALVPIPALRITPVLAAFILQKQTQLRSFPILLYKQTGRRRGSSYPQTFYNYSRCVCRGRHSLRNTNPLAACMQNLSLPFVDLRESKDGFRPLEESDVGPWQRYNYIVSKEPLFAGKPFSAALM